MADLKVFMVYMLRGEELFRVVSGEIVFPEGVTLRMLADALVEAMSDERRTMSEKVGRHLRDHDSVRYQHIVREIMEQRFT